MQNRGINDAGGKGLRNKGLLGVLGCLPSGVFRWEIDKGPCFSSLANISNLSSSLPKKISVKSLSILGTLVSGGGQRD